VVGEGVADFGGELDAAPSLVLGVVLDGEARFAGGAEPFVDFDDGAGDGERPGVTMVRGRRATVGVLTPRHGCTPTSWSLRAVVKIADRIVFTSAMVEADTSRSFMRLIHSRTCSGAMSPIRIDPNSGSRYLSIW
jgi:hypothetical protein